MVLCSLSLFQENRGGSGRFTNALQRSWAGGGLEDSKQG
jgi:hypothetical protein